MPSRELTAFSPSRRLAEATLDWAESFQGPSISLVAAEQRSAAEQTRHLTADPLELLNFPSRPLLCRPCGEVKPAPPPAFTGDAARRMWISEWLRAADESSLASNFKAGVLLAAQEEAIFQSM